MKGSALTHPVPYYSQWESADLVPEFITSARSAADDPLWQKSGADSREEYAFWAPRICGMACLRMALDHWGHPVPPSVPLLREALGAGAYVRSGDQVKGMIYAPFADWAARRWGLYAEVRPRLEPEEIHSEISRGHLVVLSVHKSIRTLDPAPPARGGHLVLAVGTGPDGIRLHNPSGLPGRSQQFAPVPWADLGRFFAGRGVVLGQHARGDQ
ncbi:C39 family peptidase [Streptomyces niveus]|uniref:C39 family peptidase n=1 Tax=Streptomyces niveus TaxID=193462 RepID=UPI00341CD2C9